MFISKKSILEKNIDLIKKLVELGKNKEEILEEIGLDKTCKSTLKIFFAKHKILTKKVQKTLTYLVFEKNKNKIINLLSLNFKYKDILVKFKLETNVSNYNKLVIFLNKNSLNKRNTRLNVENMNNPNEAHIRTYLHYADWLNIAKVAELAGIPRKTLSNFLNLEYQTKSGFKPRGLSEYHLELLHIWLITYTNYKEDYQYSSII